MNNRQKNSRLMRPLTRASANSQPTVEPLKQEFNAEHSSADGTTPAQWNQYHRVLRPMRGTVERMFDTGDYRRAFPLLHAVILLNGKPSFLRGSVHLHSEVGE